MSIPSELLASITRGMAPDGGNASAADALRVWHALFARFDLLLGPLSTALLFARTLDKHAHAFSWLPQGGQAQTAFARFAHCLDGRASDDILAVNRVLLAHYTGELADLIGASLATRLLRTTFPPDGAREE